MTSKLTKIALFAAIGIIFSVASANAQFSKAVVLLKGSVHMEQTGKAYSAKMSIRLADEKNTEVSVARSNSETGEYLVVLQPNTKYIVHIEGQDITTVDEQIETPAATSTVKLNKDFTLGLASSMNSSQDKASLK